MDDSFLDVSSLVGLGSSFLVMLLGFIGFGDNGVFLHGTGGLHDGGFGSNKTGKCDDD